MEFYPDTEIKSDWYHKNDVITEMASHFVSTLTCYVVFFSSCFFQGGVDWNERNDFEIYLVFTIFLFLFSRSSLARCFLRCSQLVAVVRNANMRLNVRRIILWIAGRIYAASQLTDSPYNTRCSMYACMGVCECVCKSVYGTLPATRNAVPFVFRIHCNAVERMLFPSFSYSI